MLKAETQAFSWFLGLNCVKQPHFPIESSPSSEWFALKGLIHISGQLLEAVEVGGGSVPYPCPRGPMHTKQVSPLGGQGGVS